MSIKDFEKWPKIGIRLKAEENNGCKGSVPVECKR